jgi:hypothetical protein
MIETPQSILAADGTSALRALVAAGGGRVTGAHFGTYDYTALCGITAAWQHMRTRPATFAKHMMQVGLAQTGVVCRTARPTSCPSARIARRPAAASRTRSGARIAKPSTAPGRSISTTRGTRW